jgi:hypothetical protein
MNQLTKGVREQLVKRLLHNLLGDSICRPSAVAITIGGWLGVPV